jgi:hypothetical protein
MTIWKMYNLVQVFHVVEWGVAKSSSQNVLNDLFESEQSCAGIPCDGVGRGPKALYKMYSLTFWKKYNLCTGIPCAGVGWPQARHKIYSMTL